MKRRDWGGNSQNGPEIRPTVAVPPFRLFGKGAAPVKRPKVTDQLRARS
jgi:hypothetical protein